MPTSALNSWFSWQTNAHKLKTTYCKTHLAGNGLFNGSKEKWMSITGHHTHHHLMNTQTAEHFSELQVLQTLLRKQLHCLPSLRQRMVKLQRVMMWMIQRADSLAKIGTRKLWHETDLWMKQKKVASWGCMWAIPRRSNCEECIFTPLDDTAEVCVIDVKFITKFLCSGHSKRMHKVTM